MVEAVAPLAVNAFVVLPLLIRLLTSTALPTNGSARVRYEEYASVLTPTLATAPPAPSRIGSAPVALSTELEPPKFTGVQSFPLPDLSSQIGEFPSIGR